MLGSSVLPQWLHQRSLWRGRDETHGAGVVRNTPLYIGAENRLMPLSWPRPAARGALCGGASDTSVRACACPAGGFHRNQSVSSAILSPSRAARAAAALCLLDLVPAQPPSWRDVCLAGGCRRDFAHGFCSHYQGPWGWPCLSTQHPFCQRDSHFLTHQGKKTEF